MGSIKALFYREKIVKEAVKNISFEIKEGEFVGFIGQNGAGKTTTLKMLSGILTPTSGEVSVLGYVPQKQNDAFKKKISIVMGQKSQIWLTLPPIESFHLIQKIYEIPEETYKKRLSRLSKMLSVEDLLHVQARKLSLGQRMKCELIASLLHDPKVLFLDEPTIGLDILSQKIIQKFLKEYNKEHKVTIILTSHYMEDIKNLCKRIIVINEGSLILDEKLADVIKKYSVDKNIKVYFDDRVLKRELSKIGKITKFSPYKATLSFPATETKEKISELVRKFPVLDLNIRDVTLEEIVADIFKRKTSR